MKIQVKEIHIKRGTRNNGQSCPIALAFREQRPDLIWPDVDADMITFGSGDNQTDRTLPEHVSNWLQAFDLGVPVKPFTFNIVLPRKRKEN